MTKNFFEYMGGTITYYYLENFFEYMGGVILFGKFFLFVEWLENFFEYIDGLKKIRIYWWCYCMGSTIVKIFLNVWVVFIIMPF